MQPPCLKEASQVCLHGCCPNPLLGFCPNALLGFPEALNKPDKPRNTVATCRQNFAATTSSIFPNTQFSNHESLPSLEDSFTDFKKAYPQFSETHQVDQIREEEYYHLSISKHTCLDYIGIGLFSHTQLQVHGLKHQPATPSSSYDPQPSSPIQHSHVPFFSVCHKTGNLRMQLLHGGHDSELEAAMKKRIMCFLNISEDDYCVVFTANRTSAFKLLAESYPFHSRKKLLTVYDYESEAVESMIKSSEKRGANFMSAEFSWPRLRIDGTKLTQMIVRKKSKQKRGLFVFPLHSRITGARYPYLWMKTAQENGWHILIDACALGPKDMDSFGLSLFRPDFLICSFYKIFGENPSGFGCLFVKKSTVPILEDSMSTGMVSLISANNPLGLMDEASDSEPEQTSKHEDELAAFSSLSGPMSNQMVNSRRLDQATTFDLQAAETSTEAVSEISDIITPGKPAERIPKKVAKCNGSSTLEGECRGLDHVDMLGLVKLSNRSRCLINWLVKALTKLRHPNREEVHLIRIYGPKVRFDRGPALAFNVFDWKGEKVEATLVQKLADRTNISLSCGFLHHISFSDKYGEVKAAVLERRTDEANGEETRKRRDKSSNMGIRVVTAAFGFLASFEDAYRLWAFLAQFLDADFVEKAKWRYTALNQQTIEV